MSRKMHYEKGNEKGIGWDKILFIIGAVLLIVYGCLQMKTMKDKEDYRKTIVRFEEIKADEGAKEETTIEMGKDESPESYQKFFEMNKDMAGWLKIPGTPIDYPVMQTPQDEEYYLRRNFFGEKDNNGTLILDTDSDITKTSNNLIIHGHNMKSGAMFGELVDYEKEEFLKEHKKIEFHTKDEVRTYEVIAVFRSKVYSEENVTFKYYQFINANSEKEFNSYMNDMKALSLYDTQVTANYGDKLLTLSTCDYQEKEGRFVVVAKRVNE